MKIDLNTICLELFTSKVRVKLIRFFYLHPTEEFHMRKINQLLNEQINAVRRELQNLEDTTFIISRKMGAKKLYKINTNFILYNEFRSLILKSQGIGNIIYMRKKELGNIKFAVLTHTYLNRENSSHDNPDLIIVGEPNLDLLIESIVQAEFIENKKLHYKIYTEKDFQISKKRNDIIIYSAMLLPRSMIIGTDEEFVI